MIRALAFAGVVYGVVWATDIYDRIIAKRNERETP